MNQPTLSANALQLAPPTVSSVWKYAKLVSEEVGAFFSKRKFEKDQVLQPGFFPLNRRVYGRDQFVAKVIEQITSGVNIFSILGPPGIGKSAVAAVLLYHEHSKERFENRRHWACFKDVTTADEFFSVLSNALSVNADASRSTIIPTSTSTLSAPENQLATTICSLQFPSPPRLLILDDLDNILESHQSTIEPILQQLATISHLTMIITVQRTTDLPQAAYSIKLPPLPPRDAKLLFLEVYPHSDPVLDKLLRQLDFHPLAIMVTARICQLQGIEPSAVLRKWRDDGIFSLPTESKELVAGETPMLPSIDNSVSRISSPDATRLFRIICALPAGVSVQDLRGIVSTVHDIDKVAGSLQKLSLISDGEHLTVLAPIRSQAVKYHQLDRQSRNDLFFYHFNLAKESTRSPSDRNYIIGIKKLLIHQQNIEAILFDALEDGDISAIEAALHYSSARCTMKPRLDLVKKALEAAKKNELGVSQEQALRDGFVALTAKCIQRFGEINIEAGKFGRWFDKAVERFEKLEDPLSVEHCKFFIAHGIWINDRKQGIKDLEHVRDTFAALGDFDGELKCQLKLADYYLVDGRIDDARQSYRRSVSRSMNPYHKALCQQVLAEIYHKEERWEDARSLLVNSLVALKKFGDRFAFAKCQNSLAFVYWHLRRIEDAREAFRQAILEYDALGRNLDAAFAQYNLGNIAEDDEAIKVLEKAIPSFWDSEFVFAGAECRLQLGVKCITTSRFEDALLHFQIARPQLQRNMTPHYAAKCLSLIIVCQLLTGDEENAHLALEAGRHELHSYFLQKGLSVPKLEDLEVSNLLQLTFGKRFVISSVESQNDHQ